MSKSECQMHEYISNPPVISVGPNCSGLIGIVNIASREVNERGHLNYKLTVKYCTIRTR